MPEHAGQIPGAIAHKVLVYDFCRNDGPTVGAQSFRLSLAAGKTETRVALARGFDRWNGAPERLTCAKRDFRKPDKRETTPTATNGGDM